MNAADPEAQRLTASDAEKQPLLSSKTQKDVGDHGDEHYSMLHDAIDTVVLGIPIFASTISWVGMKTTDSALLGHVSADALAAASLSDLVRY
jgi:Na+-driven multidrug efflux pump